MRVVLLAGGDSARPVSASARILHTCQCPDFPGHAQDQELGVSRMSPVDRILGIGSPHGDDQVGWRCIELLQQRHPTLGAETRAIAEVTEILNYVDGCQRMAIVDASRSGAPAGTIAQYTWPDSRIAGQHRHSTHGIGVADTLRLAEQLGRLPAQVVLFGVEIADCRPGADISSGVATGLAALVEKIAVGWCARPDTPISAGSCEI